MNGKDLHLSDKDGAAWWSAVVNHPKFNQVVVCAQSALFERGLSPEATKGANATIEILREFAARPESVIAFPSTGLQHETPTKPKS